MSSSDTHYELTAAVVYGVTGDKHLAAEAAWYAEAVDQNRPETLAKHFGSKAPSLYPTQFYGAMLWRSPNAPDPRSEVWQRFHWWPHSPAWEKIFNLTDPVLLGLALHGAVDFYTHTANGFVPYRSPRNTGAGVKWWRKVLPPIGHLRYGSDPDEIDSTWVRQDGVVIDNRPRWVGMLQDIERATKTSLPGPIGYVTSYTNKHERVAAIRRAYKLPPWTWDNAGILDLQYMARLQAGLTAWEVVE